jgi:hypothetical protein
MSSTRAFILWLLISVSAFGQETVPPIPSRSTVDNSGRSANITREGDIRPVPDPSVLTTQQLLREIDSTKEVIRVRLDAMDKAIIQTQGLASKSPSTEALDLEIRSVEKLLTEKFKRVDTQLAERDIQVQQAAAVVAKAVTDALQAAKEAVSEQNKSTAAAMLKSEAGFTKQIDQQQLMVQQTNKSTDERFEDLKTRNSALEARLVMIEGHSKGSADLWGFLVGGIGALIGILGILGVSFMSVSRRGTTTVVREKHVAATK